MGALIRATDWSKSPLGPVETWPQNLRTAVRIMLDAPFPVHIAWGDEFIQLYNDGYRPVLGETKHPAALGAPIRESFPELWDNFLGPKFADVQRGIPYGAEDLPVFLYRHGYLEECYFTFSYSPLRDEHDTVQGVVTMETETTERFIRERRLKTLRDLATGFAAAVSTRPQVVDRLRMTLRENPYDVPFVVYYAVDTAAQTPEVAAALAVTGPAVNPSGLAGSHWTEQIGEVARTGVPQLLSDVAHPVGLVVGGAWPEPVREAYLLPIIQPGQEQHSDGVLVFGVNPRKVFDADQQAFFEAITQHTANAFAVVASVEQERVRVEAQLELERARATVHQQASDELNRLLMQAPVAIAIFRGPAFVVELANNAYLELWGRTADAVIGKSLFEAIPESVGQGYEELLTNVLTTGESVYANELYAGLIRGGQLNQAYFNVTFQALREPDQTIRGVVVVVNEVTEQVIARKKVEASENRFRTLLETITQMTWTNRPTGEINFYNQRWYDYTGLTFEESKDWAWMSVVHPDDLSVALATFQQVMHTGEPYVAETRYRRADGEYRWHLNEALPIRDEQNAITLWVGTATDIHDRKTENERLESLVFDRTQELRNVNANLERSNFDLMQFASVASHDLKEPLRKIQMFGNILRSTAEDKLDENERNYFQRMINASSRMQSLVEDVLELSKLSYQTAICTETDLNEVVKRITDDLDVVIREKAATVTVGPLPLVEANPGQMHQLLQNLISNALKFNRKPEPAVAVEQVPISARDVAAFGIQSDAFVAIRVRDNGIGFDEAYAEKIFGIFQRLHGTKFGGTGIGLAICKKIVENHHGFIRAEGKPNEGATFTILLPVKQT